MHSATSPGTVSCWQNVLSGELFPHSIFLKTATRLPLIIVSLDRFPRGMSLDRRALLKVQGCCCSTKLTFFINKTNSFINILYRNQVRVSAVKNNVLYHYRLNELKLTLYHTNAMRGKIWMIGLLQPLHPKFNSQFCARNQTLSLVVLSPSFLLLLRICQSKHRCTDRFYCMYAFADTDHTKTS